MYSSDTLRQLMEFVPSHHPLHYQLSCDVKVMERIEQYIDAKYKEKKPMLDACGTSLMTVRVLHSGMGDTFIVEGMGCKASFFLDDDDDVAMVEQ